MKKNKLAQPAQQTQQKTEPKPKKRFSYYKLILYSSLLVILILPVVVVFSQVLDPNAGIQRPRSGAQSSPRDYPFVNPTENCYVHNKTTAVTYMVPHRSAMEWAAFKSFASKNASSIEVNCNICTPKTCADKTGLAAINNGFNCGKLLSDGCGGTLNCIDNCAVGEVCSNGPIGSACDLGDLSDCDSYIFKGHCKADNGCTPIINIAEVDANKNGRRGCLTDGYASSQPTTVCNTYQTPSEPVKALFIRGSDCFVGSPNGTGMTACNNYFFYHPVLIRYYAVTDNQHFPNVSYFSTGVSNVVNCSVGDGYTPPNCRDLACYEECMNPYAHIDCWDICCMEMIE